MFLNLQATYAMQVLPSPATRGRDLGLINLGNTVPGLAGADLVARRRMGVRHAVPGPGFLILAALVAAGGTLTLSVRSAA